MQSKPHVIKDFDKLDKELQEKVLQKYPNGFTEFLVSYTDYKTGQERFALPYETEDRYYMIRMDEYIDTDRSTDDDDDFLDNLGIDTMDKPEEIKLEDEDEEEDDDTKSNDSDDEDDDDEDLENIADENEEDEEDDDEDENI